jgi:hypothetical protein
VLVGRPLHRRRSDVLPDEGVEADNVSRSGSAVAGLLPAKPANCEVQGARSWREFGDDRHRLADADSRKNC